MVARESRVGSEVKWERETLVDELDAGILLKSVSASHGPTGWTCLRLVMHLSVCPYKATRSDKDSSVDERNGVKVGMFETGSAGKKSSKNEERNVHGAMG